MDNCVIEVNHISKTYQLGAINTGTLSHDLNRWWQIKRGKEDTYSKINLNTFHTDESSVNALQNISFKVQKGEVFGIIGRNGAGKSTLLKILSKITLPSSGDIRIKGRVASLLEIGTGFHPELTGRENIYMNGAILGMTKKEIDSKLDEIIDFSGLAPFIDTPVKRYSSGMYVNLAFSVAAHLEPEILIIDEVLAVGDAAFQKKCLGKIKNVSSEGRTILFVSHNMAAIKSITTKAMLLDKGQVTFIGDTNEAISIYMKGEHAISNYKKLEKTPLSYQDLQILSIGIKATHKNFNEPINRNDKIGFYIEYENNDKNNTDFHITFRLKGDDGQYIFASSSIQEKNSPILLGKHTLCMLIPAHFFNYDSYYIDFLVGINKKNIVIQENDILSFSVNAENKNLGEWMGKTPGYLYPKFEWSNDIIS